MANVLTVENQVELQKILVGFGHVNVLCYSLLGNPNPH